MANHQIAFNATTKVATVQAKGDALPAGSTKIGEFTHADVEPAVRDLEFDVNHVLYHHVRDALYHVDELDMSIITIESDITYTALIGFTVTPTPSVSKAAGQTQQIAATFNPTDASNKKLTYQSSNVTKVTVSSTGLISFVAAGTANVTVTSEDGAFVQVIAVTVT